MAAEEFDIEDRLLAYHMGWLTREEMAAVERLIESSPAVAARSRALSESISPLEDWNSLPAVGDLEVQVLRRLQRETGRPVVPVEDALQFTPLAPEPGLTIRLPLSLKELLVAAASVGIIFTLILPGLARASARAQRAACADNLRQIASALGRYSVDYRDQLPFAGYAEADDREGTSNWLREKTAGVRRLRNSRNRFLLLRQGYMGDAGTFLCPADRAGVLMAYEDLRYFDDFPEPRNCSYDSQIMSGSGQRVSEFPQKVVYADSNPMFDSGPAVGDFSMLNSQMHRGLSGQNVARLEGSVTWTTSPNVGVENDNIWQIGQRLNYTGQELPRFSTDSFMIP